MSTSTADVIAPPSSDNKPPGSVLAALAKIPSDAPLIAVDLDDVLSQTNRAVVEWHNDAYGTNMTLDDVYYYYYWRNPYFGNVEETIRKVEEFYVTPRLYETAPIVGALEGAQRLKELGFRLVVVTARQPRELPRTEEWLEKHFPGVFETIICTGMSQETLTDDAFITKLSKADVCKKLGAILMIDDSLENALKCTRADPPVPILLFGDYQWNKREVTYASIQDEISFDERVKREGGTNFLENDIIPLPESLTRFKNWEEVVEWVKENVEVPRL